MEHNIEKVYLLSTEEPGDYIYTLAGVVVVWDNQQFNVFCLSSNHNLFRATLLKHSWSDLEEEVVYKEFHFRLTNVTDDMRHLGWSKVADIPDILEHLYMNNQKHLFFLKKHLQK